ncbi:MAG: universal stress protein [Ignavibacteriaceae bacterium]
MKTLAFLINETDNSKELIHFAALLGKNLNAKVHVLHIQYPQVYGTSSYMGGSGATVAIYPSQLQNIAEEVKERVTGFIKELKAEQSEIPSIEFKSEIGDASAILKEKVENKTYDFVMLQSNAEPSFWLQNSVIMDVVRNVPCPVYIIPPDARYQPVKKIIYATDYNEEDITTLKSLIELAKPFDPEILALHISNDDEFDKKLKSEGFAKMLSEKTGYNKISVKMIADEEGKDAVESLVNEAENAKANLIVVLKENKNFFERLFKSSFTAELVKSTHLPILVFHKTE